MRVDWDGGCDREPWVRIFKPLPGSASRDLYATWSIRTTPGYKWNACFDDHKIFIFDQGQTNRTVVGISGARELPTIMCAGTGNDWCMHLTFQVSIDNASPPHLTAEGWSEYKSTEPAHAAMLAILNDGAWHRWTLHERKESSANAGDGVWQIWIDGVLVMNHDGAACPGRACGKVFTGANGTKWTSVSFPTTRNVGTIAGEVIWYDKVGTWWK